MFERLKIHEFFIVGSATTYLRTILFYLFPTIVEQCLASICFKVTKEINEKGVPYYTFDPVFSDGATTYDLPEYNSNVYGGLILLKSSEEMEDYLAYGDFYGEDAV